MRINEDKIVLEDSRSLALSHYVLAERLMQVEYRRIAQEIIEQPSSDTLIYMLEGGFGGFHKMLEHDLREEWKTAEELWYTMYETGTLPWTVLEDDPICALEEDENGEVETYGKRQDA